MPQTTFAVPPAGHPNVKRLPTDVRSFLVSTVQSEPASAVPAPPLEEVVPTTTNDPTHVPYDRVVTPLRVDAVYEDPLGCRSLPRCRLPLGRRVQVFGRVRKLS